MRFIRQADVQVLLPHNWEEEVLKTKRKIWIKVLRAAREARHAGKTGATLKAAIHKAVQGAINDYSGVWSRAKAALAEASFEKCWYCECKQERSDLHVDHFRPKGRVSGEANHPGYWWLALDWRNFRLACTYCNCVRHDSKTDEVAGKGDKFPLLTPPPRMRQPKDPQDRSKLLDPVIRDDVEKLTYLRNGLPQPKSTDENSEDWDRAEETIDVFHLRETRLKRAREELAIEIEDDFKVADDCYERGDMPSFATIADRLVGRIRLDAKYSTFARVVLGSYRDKEWVERLWSHL